MLWRFRSLPSSADESPNSTTCVRLLKDSSTVAVLVYCHRMPKEQVVVDGLMAWCEAGKRLREVDPRRFAQMLALARAYVSVYDRDLESEEVFNSRLDEILPGGSKASA